VLRVDHIGSTAVPVLAAKDVLDVQVMVDDLVAGERLAADLPAAAGLIRREGRWWDVDVPGGQIDKVLLGAADPARAVNCHVRQRGSPAWREALLLRDWLRAHPEGAREYAELKRRLAASHPGDVETYAEAKTPFIRSVLARAAEWADQTGWVA
jgi:dephospho-CoA kinase